MNPSRSSDHYQPLSEAPESVEGAAWLGVVSRAHVQRGVAGGFAQLGHGRAQPLRKMRRGDWLVYYSPTLELGGEPLRAFSALGQLADDEVFEFDMGGGFVPHRRRVAYRSTHEVPLDALKDRLLLCSRPNWGMALRRGHLPLASQDFVLIARAMGVDHAAQRTAATR
jgi:EVE domain